MLVGAALVVMAGCHVTSLPLWGPVAPRHGEANEVIRIKDVAYCKGSDSDAFRHRADLFLPKDKKAFPVVVLVHGGAWLVGDNRCCGLYSSVGEFLASQGIGVVMPNYRLSPTVQHPEHVRDVARAVAWTQRCIGEYGGNPDQLYLVGHSAGGHLVSLLATDESYLKAEGMPVERIKGVVSVSGVYRIPDGKMHVRLGGVDKDAVRLDQAFPIRAEGRARLIQPLGPGMPVLIDVFAAAFGADAEQRRSASPLFHVREGLPPFLLVSAERDLPTLPAMATEFHEALIAKGCAARLQQAEKRNHNSVIFLAIEPSDPVGRAIVEFIGGTSQTSKSVRTDARWRK